MPSIEDSGETAEAVAARAQDVFASGARKRAHSRPR